MRFLAAIHGADVKDEKKEEEEGIFKDPSHYEGMTEEEKERETNLMKAKLLNVFKNSPLGT